MGKKENRYPTKTYERNFYFTRSKNVNLRKACLVLLKAKHWSGNYIEFLILGYQFKSNVWNKIMYKMRVHAMMTCLCVFFWEISVET